MNDNDDDQLPAEDLELELPDDLQADSDYRLEILGAGHWPETPNWPDEAA